MTDEDWLTVALWREWQGGGMGAGYLPFAGGAAEQPVGIMACFHHMSWADSRLAPPRER